MTFDTYGVPIHKFKPLKGACSKPPPHNGHLSTTATFFCPLGGLYGEVRLYLHVTLGLLLCDI